MEDLYKNNIEVELYQNTSLVDIDMNNKLFCTFTSETEYPDLVKSIFDRYQVLYNKVFVLECSSTNEIVCTYNIDLVNVDTFLPNTILVHRKKHSNTLYTINALNELIMQENNGILDKRFMVDWNRFSNSILLTKGSDLQILKTDLLEIVKN